ncbi:SLBB domain-containing protein [Geobacter chapellei]|uniref:SLBB domain-containing protein n=2 Tax=Pelotalea chapellei TaxID=44671 RepID=A0ABS5U5N3_9BACT|nr:SLBB domain-containing protein [Pelotalea chapellei]
MPPQNLTSPLPLNSPPASVNAIKTDKSGFAEKGMAPASLSPVPQDSGLSTSVPPTSLQPTPVPPAPVPVDIPVSAIEKAMSSGDDPVVETDKSQHFKTGQLRQFGYNFFRSGDLFAPLTDIPVGPDYIVGPGDTIIVSAWGSLEGTYPLEVNRNGEIQLPRIGPLKVWGVTYERLPQLIRNNLAKVFRDFNVSVTMGKLKVIKVYVVGEVANPGDYNLNSLSTVINALSAAGGPLKSGSLRNISIRRGGKLVETLDLYDFFLSGDKSRDVRLQPGDTLFVPVIGPIAGIAGNVRRPAIYELRNEKNLHDLLNLAGGLLPTGYLQRVQISRIEAHTRKTISDFNLDTKKAESAPDSVAQTIPVRDLDLVRIFPIDNTQRDQVRLEGYVLRPGDYALKPGLKISNLLLPDNILPEYYREAGELTRLVPPDLHPEKIIFNPAKALAGDPAHDISLTEFDTVRIFSRVEMEELPKVRIGGEVQRPGEYRLFKNMAVRDLLIMAGNPKLTAYLKSAEIARIRKSGESVVSYPITIDVEKVLAEDPKANIPLEPFDELTIRRIPNWSEETDRYVTLKGEFVFPGTYPVYKGEHLSSVIARAGGFASKAYLPGTKFTRISVQQEQQKRMDEILARTEQDIAEKQSELASVATSKEELEATRSSLEALLRNVEHLKKVKAEGRMVIRLKPLDEFRGSNHDLELAGGDVLEVPARPNSVNVFGQVYNTSTIIHEQGEPLTYYLEKSGGATKDADMDEAYVIRADGSVSSRQNAPSSFIFFDSFMSTELNPGDSVVVPQRMQRTAWLREIKDITTIISQIALTAGTVMLGLR